MIARQADFPRTDLDRTTRARTNATGIRMIACSTQYSRVFSSSVQKTG